MKAEMNEYVVLLHGLARTPRAMETLEKQLTQSGYTVMNVGYPSRQYPVEELAQRTFCHILQQLPEGMICHFVTHSMGGILLRYFLSKNKFPQLGRTVMLGPPNQGSEIVDKLHHYPGFYLMNGPAGMQLGTQQNSIPKNLGAVDFELGVIAGYRSINLLLSSFILPGKNDGKVTVESTKTEGMSDHLILPVTHTFMMKNKQVIQQVIHFLCQGKFAGN